MPSQILVRYGELALKSAPVRREFESFLRRNILDQFVREGLTGRLRSDHGHLYVEVDDGPRALRVLQRVFGITSLSLVHEVPSDRAAIRDRLLELSDPGSRRGPRSPSAPVATGGRHPFTSQELARDLGGDVLERFADRHLQVDLEDHPDVELFVEVRGPRTYLSFDRVRGPGGLPLGVAGRLVALVDGPRGALGAYLMMKRGCRVAIVAVPSGEVLARDVLGDSTRGPDLDCSTDPYRMGRCNGVLERAVPRRRRRSLPLRVDEYPAARAQWGDRVLFSPTVGLSDSEVEARWKNAVALIE